MPLPSILVVDDNDRDQDAIKNILAQFDFSATGARSAQEALAAVRDQKYAVILLSLNLPDMDSYECVRQLKRLELDASSQTPVVAMVNPDGEPIGLIEQKVLRAGMDGLIQKPFSAEAVRRILLRHAYEPRRPNLKTLRPLPPEARAGDEARSDGLESNNI
ncbi:MAG: response regulator [Cyanobacteria bacterium SZAS TMP-1]|nr:response regulator [Cyanobacteria bacterium SZAS TMP-1]